MNFISGEKIQFLCDHFIGTQNDFNFNPNVSKYKDRFIQLGHTEIIDNKPLIFCYTHLLDDTNLLINTLKMMKNPFKLIFHNSDYSFDINHLKLFNELHLLIHIYTQNINVNHPSVTPLPIGLSNIQWIHGQPNIHMEVYNTHIEKTKEIYFNFNINTNQAKRQNCVDIIKNKGISWNEPLPYKQYLTELKCHKYAICPEGNGIDTHRFWECLYMNVIPICKKNILYEYYSKHFPIILLNDWDELDIKLLEQNRPIINHKYLDMDYIKHIL